MQTVKVFLPERVRILPIEKVLKENGILVNREVSDCDVSIALYGLFTNPLVLRGKKLLAYFFLDNVDVWNTAFYSLHKPILKHYYDGFIDLTRFNTLTEIGEELANRIKQLENEAA